MSMKMNIQMGRRGWGSLTLDESREALERQGIRRTGDGFLLPIPATIRLAMEDRDVQPMVTDLQVVLYLEDGLSSEFGVAHDRTVYKGGIGGFETSTSLHLRGQLSALEMVEKWRGHHAPSFRVECSARGYLLYAAEGNRWLASEPFEMTSGSGSVTYPQDAWVALLRRVGAVGNVLVEIPIPAEPPLKWVPVWKAFQEAYENFCRGGETGWKNTIVSIRLALEEWDKIEPFKGGPGWNPPTKPTDKDKWSKEDRLDGIRWYLKHYANYGPHSHADQWTRADAELLLTSFAGLLSKRNP